VNLDRADTCDTASEHRCHFAGLGISRSHFSARVIGSWIVDASSTSPLDEISAILESSKGMGDDSENNSGWMILLGYELGRAIETKAQYSSQQPKDSRIFQPDFPLAVIQRWSRIKDDQIVDADRCSESYEIGTLHSSLGREKYIKAVERVQQYISAGDIYQANIAHQLRGSFTGDVLACYSDLISRAQPRAGAMMEFEFNRVEHAILSISPEIYLEYDPRSNVICTEPMKGTRPLNSNVSELRDSIKDRAELDMITDLMRNDLGRICELGSVRVADHRRIESHQSGVLQAVARIEGLLRKQIGIREIIQGTYPPGSITGTPKVRAMQVIDELEACSRNSYCGSMLVLDNQGRFKSSVLIRTAHIWGDKDPNTPKNIQNGQFVYPVGAGIVADSDPQAEWEETLLKAAVLRDALGLDLDE